MKCLPEWVKLIIRRALFYFSKRMRWRMKLMKLNRKVILDWDEKTQRRYNIWLPAEGDVDESQKWCTDMKIKTWTVDSWHTEDMIWSSTTSCFHGNEVQWRTHSAMNLSICNTICWAKAAYNKAPLWCNKRLENWKLQPQKFIWLIHLPVPDIIHVWHLISRNI